MSHTYKLTEVVGSSTVSSDDAIRNAIATASLSLKNLGWVRGGRTPGAYRRW